jgi:hypothetical protein
VVRHRRRNPRSRRAVGVGSRSALELPDLDQRPALHLPRRLKPEAPGLGGDLFKGQRLQALCQIRLECGVAEEARTRCASCSFHGGALFLVQMRRDDPQNLFAVEDVLPSFGLDERALDSCAVVDGGQPLIWNARLARMRRRPARGSGERLQPRCSARCPPPTDGSGMRRRAAFERGRRARRASPWDDDGPMNTQRGGSQRFSAVHKPLD